jgi:hypothetical protein
MSVSQIAQYEILAEIGAGGMGVVYRAMDVDLQREVALKRLRSEFAASPAVLERFRREAQLQGKLNHPNITQLYSLVHTSDAFCIAMEFVDGVGLHRLMPMAWQDAAPVLLQVLDGIGYAHRQGVLHRDIKPENILIDRHGTAKVMDFGIAHAVGAQRLTREKALVGTIEYIAPERIQGGHVDQRSDIYSIGLLLFELMTGRLPHTGANEYEVLKWHIESETPAISEFAPVPRQLDEIARKASSKSPDHRYASCDEMAAVLRSLCAASGVDCSAAALRRLVDVASPAGRFAHTCAADEGLRQVALPAPTKLAQVRSRNKKLLFGVAACLVVIALSVAIFTMRKHETVGNANQNAVQPAVNDAELTKMLTSAPVGGQRPPGSAVNAETLPTEESKILSTPEQRSAGHVQVERRRSADELGMKQIADQQARQLEANQQAQARQQAAEAEFAQRQRDLEAKAAEQQALQKQLEDEKARIAQQQQAQTAAETAKRADEQRTAVHQYNGPRSGEIVWEGPVAGTTLVTIQGSSSDVGQVISGALPGVVVMVQPVDNKHVGVASAPGPSNSFQRLVLRMQGKGNVREVIRWSIP